MLGERANGSSLSRGLPLIPSEKTESTIDINSVLTQREREIAELVAFGRSNKEIARQLGLRNQTVRNMLVHVFRKTSTRKRTQLAVKLVLLEYDSTISEQHEYR